MTSRSQQQRTTTSTTKLYLQHQNSQQQSQSQWQQNSERIGQMALQRVERFGERLTGSSILESPLTRYFAMTSSSATNASSNLSFMPQHRTISTLVDDDVVVDDISSSSSLSSSPQQPQQRLLSSSPLVTTTTTNSNTKLASSLGRRKSTTTSAADIELEQKQVWEALSIMETDMQLLDRLAGNKPQLSVLELTLLLGAVLSSACSPFLLQGRLTEFIAPSAAAFTAAMGIAAEYTGRVAVADGKEVAAASMQCAAEAEGFLAAAERAKAITPLCVGVGATAATLALLVPVLLDTLGLGSNLQFITEVYLLCPLIAILASAVAGLAVQETRALCDRAIGVGNRRFARSGMVARTWLSSTELIERKSKGTSAKWQTFTWSVIPAPIVGALCPGALPTKTIVVAAFAAAESAYYLARAEALLARATDAVALKSRSAAISDTYANQGARSSAILPFTSALSGLCAAATAAIVELPFVEALAGSATWSGTLLEMGIVTAFPAISALFAAAAQVSKARCEVDAEAAMQAASTIALPYNDLDNDPIMRPWKGVAELVRLTFQNSILEPFRRLFRRLDVRRWLWRRRFSRPRKATSLP